MSSCFFDKSKHKWREVAGEPGDSYKIKHFYTILGYDHDAGTLDMVVYWEGDGGHCHKHRHTATTTVLVLEGEQHLWDYQEDGSLGEERIRRAGEYGLMLGTEPPHLERGGDGGGLVFFGSHCNDGKLYEILNDDLTVLADVTIEGLVADFEEGAVYL